MNLTNGEIRGRILPALEELGKFKPESDQFALALKLRRILRSLRQHAEDVGELERGLAMQFGPKDEEGRLIFENGRVKFKTPKEETAFSDARRILMDTEFEYQGETLTVEEIQKLPVTVGMLADLGDLLCEDQMGKESGEAE